MHSLRSATVAILVLLPTLSACGSSFSSGTPTSGGSGGGSGAVAMAGSSGATPSGGAGPGTGGTVGSGGSISGGGAVSGGATGSAGSIGVGGAVGIGGAAGSGGSAAACDNQVVFRMVPSSTGTSSPQYCVDSTCGNSWLTVTPAGGDPLTLNFPCGQVDCTSCQPSQCPAIACIQQPLTQEGVSFTWNGATYADSAGCSAGCVAMHCAAPGHYVARMCAAKADSVQQNVCVASSEVVCSEPVEFDLPKNGEVVGQLP